MFSIGTAVVGLIPNVISLIDDIAVIFGGNVYISVISHIVTAIVSLLNLAEKLLLLVLGLLALKQETIKIPVIDDFINKYMQ